jgi:hypothetical protein
MPRFHVALASVADWTRRTAIESVAVTESDADACPEVAPAASTSVSAVATPFTITVNVMLSVGIATATFTVNVNVNVPVNGAGYWLVSGEFTQVELLVRAEYRADVLAGAESGPHIA